MGEEIIQEEKEYNKKLGVERREQRNKRRKALQEEMTLSIFEKYEAIKKLRSNPDTKPLNSKVVTIKLSPRWQNIVDTLVADGYAVSRSEFIRSALQYYIEQFILSLARIEYPQIVLEGIE